MRVLNKVLPSPSSPLDLDALAEAIQKHIAKHKHDPDKPLGPNKITREHTLGNYSLKTPWGTLNFTPSVLDQIRANEGWEVIQVIDPTRSTGVELTRRLSFELPFGIRMELQTIGVYSDGTLRIVGFGFTRDKIDEKSKEAISGTLEFKLMSDDVLRLAAMAAPGAAAEAAKLLGSGAMGAVGEVLLGAVPVVSALLAISTARWAYKIVKDPNESKFRKLIAVGHAIADAVRVVFPLPATLANLGLLLAALGVEAYRAHQEKKSKPPTGPPPEAPPEELPEGAVPA